MAREKRETNKPARSLARSPSRESHLTAPAAAANAACRPATIQPTVTAAGFSVVN